VLGLVLSSRLVERNLLKVRLSPDSRHVMDIR
jgi:hypothetical protein